MSEVALEVLNPEKLSRIKVTYLKGKSRITPYYEILVIKYSGKYGIGAAGNGDAQFIYAKGEFGLNTYEPTGAILDFGELEYKWGDMLELAFSIGSKQYRAGNFPIALVLGETCKEAVGTLIHGIKSKEPATTEEWIFDSFNEAWKFIEEKIEKRPHDIL